MNPIDIALARTLSQIQNKEAALKKTIEYYKISNKEINPKIANYILLTSLNLLIQNKDLQAHYDILVLIPPIIFENSYPGIFSTYFLLAKSESDSLLDICFSYVLSNLTKFPDELQKRIYDFFIENSFIYLKHTFRIVSNSFDYVYLDHFVMKIVLEKDEYKDFKFLNNLVGVKIDKFFEYNKISVTHNYYCKALNFKKIKIEKSLDFKCKELKCNKNFNNSDVLKKYMNTEIKDEFKALKCDKTYFNYDDCQEFKANIENKSFIKRKTLKSNKFSKDIEVRKEFDSEIKTESYKEYKNKKYDKNSEIHKKHSSEIKPNSYKKSENFKFNLNQSNSDICKNLKSKKTYKNLFQENSDDIQTVYGENNKDIINEKNQERNQLTEKNLTNNLEENLLLEITSIIFYLIQNRKLIFTECLFLFCIESRNEDILRDVIDPKKLIEFNIFSSSLFNKINLYNFDWFLKFSDKEFLKYESNKIALNYLIQYGKSIKKTEFANIVKWNAFLKLNYTELLNTIFSNYLNNDGCKLIPFNHLSALNSLLQIKCSIKIEKYLEFLINDMHSRETTLENIGSHLSILFIIVKKDFLKRSSLKKIYKSLLFLDNEDLRIRCAVYEIYCYVFKTYQKMDNYIENIKRNDELKINERDKKISKINLEKYVDNLSIRNDLIEKRKNSQNEKLLKNKIEIYAKNTKLELFCKNIKKYDRISKKDIINLNKNNVKVMAAKIWNDLKDEKTVFEVYFSNKLMRKTIEYTGSFYDQRFQKNKILNNLKRQHAFCDYEESEKVRYYEFVMLVYEIVKKFDLVKTTFECIFEICIDLFSAFEKKIKNILTLLHKKDKYFFFYLVLYSEQRVEIISRNSSLRHELINIIRTF